MIESDFDNDPDRFDSYGKGWARLFEPWKMYLGMLDWLRHSRNMRILMLAHSAVNKIGNPDGDDYQSNTPELNEKWIWNQTNAWADNVLFANLEVVAVKKKGDSKAKVEKGDRRLLYVHSTASHFAKNRWGLRHAISMGNSGSEAYANLMQAITDVRDKRLKKDPAENPPEKKEKPAEPIQADAALLASWNKRINAAKKFPICLNLFADIVALATTEITEETHAVILTQWTERCAALADGDLDNLFMLKAKFEEHPELPADEAKKILARAQ